MIEHRFVDGPSTYARVTRNIADVDPIVARTARAIGAAARAGYRAGTPSTRIKKAIKTQTRKRGQKRVIRTGVVEQPMGPPIHGKDPGTVAVTRFTDRGTGWGTGRPNRRGDGRIRRVDTGPDGEPLPFTFLGRPLPWVRGQQAQDWVRPVREAADAATVVLTDDMDDHIDRTLGRRSG